MRVSYGPMAVVVAQAVEQWLSVEQAGFDSGDDSSENVTLFSLGIGVFFYLNWTILYS